ncbi:hypothetical protein [Flavobacterium sp.]|jgi:hypothetical protein|uniref:hypothetical protein n=1 Tax=Flavobacterium sp. TaxID=239 RepID=UPI0037C0312C
MKNAIVIILLLLFVIYSCRSLNLIDVKDLDEKKWSELEKISVKSDRGYKFVKTTFKDGQYNTSMVSASTNMKITADEKRKIEKILQKYD